jgi:hypothetical protein
MNEASGLLSSSVVTTPATRPGRVWVRPDGRRTLQLTLATIWLLDGVLQMQAFFFTRAFGTQMISMSAEGNPSVIARSILWSGRTIGHHAVIINALFALAQVAIGLGIAWRPTLKLAVAASIVWSVGVWWVGEGFGGVFSGAADPINGAPGAVIIYGLLAVLLWPSDRPGPAASFIAGRAVGAPIAKALWLVLWGSLSYFAVLGANRSSQGLHDLIIRQTNGEPEWVAWMDRHAASGVDHRGLVLTVVLAVVLAIVAVGVYLPRHAANTTLVLAIVLGLLFWVVGQNFGALFTNGATDVNSGPLLVLLGFAYWRHTSERVAAPDTGLALIPEAA